MTEFSVILGNAFRTVAAEHGLSYPEGGASAWGRTGAAYLAYSLCGMPASTLRSLQYESRDTAGPVLMDCKWYDRMTDLCLGGQESTVAAIPHPEYGIKETTVSKSLFLEMLDFCREG